MNESHSVSPAEREPEPDSTVPIRIARQMASFPCQSVVNFGNRIGCSKPARNRDALGLLCQCSILGFDYPGSGLLWRDPVSRLQ